MNHSVPNVPGLGPHCVGLRVVVRRRVRGERGPTGGPAFTDVLGVMESWADGITTVRAADGRLAEIAVTDIVSGKPVPPRPSVRHRALPGEVQRRAASAWPAAETAGLGEWLLRAASGYTHRANSVLAVGDAGLPPAAAADAVRSFYAARRLPALAQVVVGSAEHDGLAALGWVPEGGEVVVLVGGAAAALRAARGGRVGALVVSGEPDVRWLAPEERAARTPDAARAVLAGPAQVAFVSVLDGPADRPGTALLARGRVALDDRPDPWALLTSVWVEPSVRRRGLALAVVRALLDHAAERGATTAHLQVHEDNAAALALYHRIGFTEHHRYRYLRPE